MKRWVLAICAAVLVVGSVVGVRTFKALGSADAQGLVAQLVRRAERVQVTRGPDFLAQQQLSWARRFHRGQLPCGRWQPSAVTPAQLAAAVAFKSVTEDAVEFGAWLQWRFAHEELERHGPATDAERLAPALEALDGLDAELLRERPQLAVAALRSAGGVLGAHLARVEDTAAEPALRPEDGPRRKLEALVEEHFTLSSQWPAVEAALREELTRARFAELSKLLTEDAANGEPLLTARQLTDTRRTRLRRLDVDGFEVPITVSREGDDVVLRSTPEREERVRAPLSRRKAGR